MTFNEYQEKALRTKTYGVGDSIIYPTLGLASEAGEVAGKVKKVLRDNGGVFTLAAKEAIAYEISDCTWYLAAIASDLGYTLDRIAEMNITKLEDRRARGVIHGSGDTR